MQILLKTCLVALTLTVMVGCPRPVEKREPPKPRAPAPTNELRVRFFAAGHGDSILLTTTDGHRVLVDAGRFVGGDHLVRRRLIPWFKQHHIRKLDAFVERLEGDVDLDLSFAENVRRRAKETGVGDGVNKILEEALS